MFLLKKTAALLLALQVALPALAEGPPSSNGVISNPTLVKNQDVAKAQAAGAISTFMAKGAQTCDSDGKNCRSVFGSDGTPDYASLQQSSQTLTGIQSFSFMGADGESAGDSQSVSSQMGTLAIACGESKVFKVAGIAVKLKDCAVTAKGDARITAQVCTAPMRSNPVTPPDNEVDCSSDPAAPNFRPPVGKVCKRPACDTEPEGTLNGWSQAQTISWQASMPSGSSEDAKTKNGLGLIFYPPLSGGTAASFSADADNLTAVKVIQTFVNNETQRTAIGLKVAYRYKTKVTQAMMVQGPSSVPNPSDHTAQWDTILKLQGNEKIPQYQQKYAANGSQCLQQITGGIAKDGKITVCDPTYTNESGIKPGATTAQVATEGQDCGTTPQCLKEVVNTQTWTESCSAEVPTAMRTCTTTQDHTMNTLSWTRTRSQEICHEKRTVAEYGCRTYAQPEMCTKQSLISQGGVNLGSSSGDTAVVFLGMADEFTGRYRLGAVGDNYWGTGYYKRTFTIDILNKDAVKTFRMYQVGYDDLMAAAVNDNWVWQEYGGGWYDRATDSWGRMEDGYCYSSGGDTGDVYCYPPYWSTHWERRRSYNYDVNVDLRPYLKEGRNIIRMDTGVVGGGEGWVYLEISAWQMKCNTITVNECGGYEAAN